MPSRIILSRELGELLKLLAHPERVRLIEELRELWAADAIPASR